MSDFTGTGTANDPVVLPDVNITASPIMPANSGPPGAWYTERALSFKFQLGKGSFGITGQNTVTVGNLRAHCTILKNGYPSMNSAEMRIYGLTPDIMNALTTLGTPRPMERLNTVTVSAGDTISGANTLVYSGIIQEAWQDFDGQPETFLEVQSSVGTLIANAPVPPISFPGSADAATIMSVIAKSAGRAFSNSGVNVTLSNPYFAGTALQQAHDLARAANINFDDDGITFFIWPLSGVKQNVIPMISPDTGLNNYPRYTSQGIALRTLFNINLVFGGQCQVVQPPNSGIPAANGLWTMNKVSHDLSAQIINGPWFTDIECNRQPGVPNG